MDNNVRQRKRVMLPWVSCRVPAGEVCRAGSSTERQIVPLRYLLLTHCMSQRQKRGVRPEGGRRRFGNFLAEEKVTRRRPTPAEGQMVLSLAQRATARSSSPTEKSHLAQRATADSRSPTPATNFTIPYKIPKTLLKSPPY